MARKPQTDQYGLTRVGHGGRRKPTEADTLRLMRVEMDRMMEANDRLRTKLANTQAVIDEVEFHGQIARDESLLQIVAQLCPECGYKGRAHFEGCSRIPPKRRYTRRAK